MLALSTHARRLVDPTENIIGDVLTVANLVVAGLEASVDVLYHVQAAGTHQREEHRDIALLIAVLVTPILDNNVERCQFLLLHDKGMHGRIVALIDVSHLDAWMC